MKFLGFETHDDVPDARTIWLFAETLIADEAVAKLFARFDAMLQADGFQANGGQSSMPPLAKRRASAPEATTPRRSRKAEFPPIGATKRRRIRTRACWTKKNSVAFYDYKNHVSIDRNNKPIRKKNRPRRREAWRRNVIPRGLLPPSRRPLAPRQNKKATLPLPSNP
jgi:transposase, IS5 family